MKKPLIYVCHYKGYSERLKKLNPSYEYKTVCIGDELDMPASNNVKHYAVMANDSDAIIIEDDTVLPDDFDFEKMVREAKEQSLDIVFFGGVSKDVESAWGISMSVQSPSEEKLVYHHPAYLSRCSHGYWISKEACEKILSDGMDVSQGMDHALNGYIQRLKLKAGWTHPCVYQSTAEALSGQRTMPHFYHLTEGEDWFTYPKLYSEMVRLAPMKSHFVEVGVWKGRSASFLATEIINSGKIITLDLVDTWNGSEEHTPLQEDLFGIFMKNIQPVLPYVNIRRTNSISASSSYEDRSLDFVFIDAAHDYENVKADINAWLPKIKPGGYLAGHDYPDWEGVVKAVDEIFGKENIDLNEDCWLYFVEK
jgi:hypothetical protein